MGILIKGGFMNEETGNKEETTQISFRALQSLKDRIVEMAMEKNVTQQGLLGELFTFALEHIDTQPEQPELSDLKEVKPIPKELALQNATKTILDYLAALGQGHIPDSIAMVCQDGYGGLEVWRWMLGAIRYVVEAGFTTSVILEDEDVGPIVPKLAKCECTPTCGESFVPNYYGQRFKDNIHGARYTREQTIIN